MKVLFEMALRQTTGFVERLLRLVGLDWKVPDFSTLSRRQKTLAANIPVNRRGIGPLIGWQKGSLRCAGRRPEAASLSGGAGGAGRRVPRSQARVLKRQLSLPVSTMRRGA